MTRLHIPCTSVRLGLRLRDGTGVNLEYFFFSFAPTLVRVTYSSASFCSYSTRGAVCLGHCWSEPEEPPLNPTLALSFYSEVIHMLWNCLKSKFIKFSKHLAVAFWVTCLTWRDVEVGKLPRWKKQWKRASWIRFWVVYRSLSFKAHWVPGVLLDYLSTLPCFFMPIFHSSAYSINIYWSQVHVVDNTGMVGAFMELIF